jgi:hypothetical protein
MPHHLTVIEGGAKQAAALVSAPELGQRRAAMVLAGQLPDDPHEAVRIADLMLELVKSWLVAPIV